MKVGDTGWLYAPHSGMTMPELADVCNIDLSVDEYTFVVFPLGQPSHSFVCTGLDFYNSTCMWIPKVAVPPPPAPQSISNQAPPWPRQAAVLPPIPKVTLKEFAQTKDVHASHAVVKSQAAGKDFWYCRDCKVEVDQPLEQSIQDALDFITSP